MKTHHKISFRHDLRYVIGMCVRLLTTDVYVIVKWYHITLSVGKTAGRKPLSSVGDCTGHRMRILAPSVTAVRMSNLTHQYFSHIFVDIIK